MDHDAMTYHLIVACQNLLLYVKAGAARSIACYSLVSMKNCNTHENPVFKLNLLNAFILDDTQCGTPS